MEYEKIISLLANTRNHPSKFKTKTCVEIHDGSNGVYNIGSQIKFKTSIFRSSLYNYKDTHIFAKGTKTVPNTGIAAAPNNRNKKLIFRNFAPFTDCISQINNKRIDHANDIDIVMQMYNLTEYNDYYSKTSASLWECYRDEACINNNGVIIDVLDDPDSASLKCKQKITSQTGNDGIKDVQIMVPLKNI